MKLKNLFNIRILFLYSLPIICFSTTILNDDLAIIRQRVLELSIWPPSENISSYVESAIEFNHTLNSSCYWSDVNYTDQNVVLWNTERHLFRVTIMLQALTVNGSRIKNDIPMLMNVHCALNVWLMNDWTNPNWWFNEINVPLQLTSELLMLGDNATNFELEKITEISYRAAWWIPNPTHVGANVVWEIQCEIYRSLATKNMTGIEEGFSRMWQDINISSTEAYGVQHDWSYHFHLYQLMSGSYGIIWVNNILLFLECSLNTHYQPDDETLLFFANFLINGDAWMIITNEWDWQIQGRSIAVPNTLVGHGLITDWIRTLSELIQIQDIKNKLIEFADRLDSKPNTSLLIGNRHFFVSDYQVHRRSNWIATIKMQSIRTQPVECILGLNIKEEHGGQGVLNLYIPGSNDYFNIFPILDWQAINGITVEHSIPLGQCDHGSFNIKRLIFVGGVSDGQYGLAMMDTATYNLTVKRSWHFYDDMIIALATNLTLTTSVTVWTTLASRLLPSGNITFGFFNSTIHTFSDGNYSFPYIRNATSNV